MEKETTGLYLTGHPMDEYRDVVKQCKAASMGAILSDFAQEGGPAIYHDEQRVTLAGVITASRTKTTRNNSLMAYVTLEDDTASMEMLVFARVLGEAGPYLKEGWPSWLRDASPFGMKRRPSSCATGYAPWIR